MSNTIGREKSIHTEPKAEESMCGLRQVLYRAELRATCASLENHTADICRFLQNQAVFYKGQMAAAWAAAWPRGAALILSNSLRSEWLLSGSGCDADG